ncbi:MAG: NADP-dependent phosphogluconate dehydrogenase [Pseudomonadota bacterium]
MSASIGLIGLGVMGGNLALNIAERGYSVAVYNRTVERTAAFLESADELAGQFVPTQSLEELVAAVAAPRMIIVMVPAGAAVDAQLEALLPHLEPGDLVLDCGNADFNETQRRLASLADTGIGWVGVGVSGGSEGARFGPSIMVGCSEAEYERVGPVLSAIAAQYEGDACCARLGTDGAGHFVKTLHNGIEYADMQMLAEAYGIMRDGLGWSAAEIGAVFERWNEGVLNAYLVEITAEVLKVEDAESGGPLVDVIADRAGQKGTGTWSAIEAQKLGRPATTVEAAVSARCVSALAGMRQSLAELYSDAGGNPMEFTEDTIELLELALLAGRLCAYAQGFSTIAAASREHHWDVPLTRVAEIWRAGCIIRSRLLDDMAAAFRGGVQYDNLLTYDQFVPQVTVAVPALRHIVGTCVAAGLPIPALSAALAWFDGIRQARGTANLIQGQRDFFGSHGFERLDKAGDFHGPW